ncbi:MAG: hypothetical protein V4447_06590 [Pseudomonadota bacterium]
MANRPSPSFLPDFIVSALFLLFSASADAASFPCDKAKSVIEKTICSQPELSDLDEYLGRYYWAARESLKHADACMVSDQRAWIKTVRDACQDAACLKRVYLNRLAQLDALQPGATSLRNIALPKVAPLVWIIPPAADQVAAPRNMLTMPLVAKGKLLNEVATGDGYVLLSEAEGRKHLIVPLMLLEPQTNEALATLARDPKAIYEIAGRTEIKGDGTRPFSSSQCSYVFRVVP